MACVRWPLSNRRPAIEVDIVVPGSDQAYRKLLLADTGAGSLDAPFELLLDVVGIERPPLDFDGIAGFRFLNRFTYGNLGHPDQFGLEL